LVVIAGEPALVRHVVEAAEELAAGPASVAAPVADSVTAPVAASVTASVAAPEVVAAGLADRLQQAT
jgi:hypothetical protein